MLRSGPNVKILASQKLNVVLVNVKTAVSCLNKVIFARSLRSRAYCSSVNTVQNPNSVPALTFGCSTSRSAASGDISTTNSIHVSPPECFRYSISEVDMRKHAARRTALPVASHFMHSRHRICRSRKRLAHREHVLYSTGNRAAMPLRTAGRGSLTSAVPRGPQLPCTQPEYWHKKRPGQQPRQTTWRCSCSSSSQYGRVRPP